MRLESELLADLVNDGERLGLDGGRVVKALKAEPAFEAHEFSVESAAGWIVAGCRG